MCGICVYRGKKTLSFINSTVMDSIISLLSLRGPDEHKYLRVETSSSPIYLVETRLKIVGTQNFPLTSSDGSVLLANGEVYNYQELFKQLCNHNPTPDENDFFVVLELYRKYKQLLPPNDAFKKTLSLLKGDFAVVLIDQNEKMLYIARDYSGIRPLWYVWNNHTSWGICSEKRPLETLGFDPKTIIQVKPGYFSCFSYDGLVGDSSQWEPLFDDMCKDTPPVRSQYTEVSLEMATKTIKEYLTKSLNYHLLNNNSNTNQSIGMFLSGGIDSTLLYQLSKRTDQKIVPLSIGLPGSSDLKALQVLMGQNNQEWIIEYLSIEKIQEHLPTLLARLETRSPLDIAIAMPIYFLAKKAKELGIKICITGQGADELFGGYQRYETLWNGQQLEELHNRLWYDLRTIAEHNLERDDLAATSHGIELRLPYLDFALVRYVTSLPLTFLFRAENGLVQRKHLLRKIGNELGLPKEILYRKKVAIQYGSGFQKILAKLAHNEKLTINQYLSTF